MKRLGIILISMLQQLLVDAEWSYSGQTGPKYWYKLYPACAEARQSPIEIHHDVAETDDTLTSFHFEGYDHTRNHENFTVWNDGYTVTVRIHGDVKIRGGGLEGRYSLKHFHFHWGSQDDEGSEHMVDGKAYPLEMHLVHQTQKYHAITDALEDPTGLAVLGIFATVGKFHPYFQEIIENLRDLDVGDWASVQPFPINRLLPNDTETFYRYQGSLTTPPCSESVVWTVFRQPIEISEDQLEQIRLISAMSNVTSNYRPVQRLNGRRLYVRKKSDDSKGRHAIHTVDVEDNFFPDGWNPDSGATNAVVSTMCLLSLTVLGITSFIY